MGFDPAANFTADASPRSGAAGYEFRAGVSGIASGSSGLSTGGPAWLDVQRSKRAPSAYELVNAFKNVAYACVQLNANGVSRVPLRLYAKTGSKQSRPRRAHRSVPGERERYLRSLPGLARTIGGDDIDEITEHPFLDAIASPNDHMDGNLLIQLVARQLDVIGVAYLFPERPMRPDGTGDPAQARAGMRIWGLLSQYVLPQKGTGTELIRAYRHFGDTYAAHELVRIRNLSLRDPYLSFYAPLHACFESIGLGDYYLSATEAFLKNDARMSLIVGPKDPDRPFGEAERSRLESDINNRFSRGHQGRVWVTDGAYDVSPIAYPPSDLSGLELSKWERLLVANCFDVPISLLQAEDTNRSVASEGTHQHQYYAIAPRCLLIAAALTHQMARPVDERLFFAFDDPVARDEERHAKVVDMQVKNGTRSINETRSGDGLEPVEWGDEPWFSSSQVQPSAAEERATADREAKAEAAKQLGQAKPGANGDGKDAADPEAETEADAEKGRLWDRFGRALDLLERELVS